MTRRDRLKARQICEEAGWDPIRHLITLIKAQQCPVDLQITAIKALLPYIHPRLADLEISVEQNPDSPAGTVNILNLFPTAEARRVLEDAVIVAATREREKRAIEGATIKSDPQQE